MNIKHNATYLPVKSNLRPATAEEISKYKDANKHGRKRVPGTASTGEASASGATMEPEGLAGPSKERDVRRSKVELQPTSDKGGKRDSERMTETHKDKESKKDSSRDDARKARETAEEKDAAEDESTPPFKIKWKRGGLLEKFRSLTIPWRLFVPNRTM